MHEQDFHILEGREITLPELGREIENITGRTIVDSTGEIKRVAHLPNFESDTDTVATFKLNHRNDFVDATFVAPKDQRDRLKRFQYTLNSLVIYLEVN